MSEAVPRGQRSPAPRVTAAGGRIERELTLTQLQAMRLRTTDGRRLGPVRDVRTGHLSSGPSVDAVLVGARRGPWYVVPWALLEPSGDVHPSATVSIRSDDLGTYAVPDHDLRDASPSTSVWLGRDVRDSQVVDLTGCRLARVSEILLITDGCHPPVPFAVDLGLGALMARVGLGRAGRHLPGVIVQWEDLYLASAGGHRSEIAVSADRLRKLDAARVAEIIARLPVAQSSQILQSVDPVDAATAIVSSDRHVRHRLVSALPAHHRVAILRAVPDVMARDLRAVAHRPARRRLRRTDGWQVRRPRRPGR